MGRQSNAKKQKQALVRARPRLLEALRQQQSFLRSSSKSFDEGEEAEALRLAVTIRVLVHDTKSSHSLLGQLGVKEQLRYVDTAGPVKDGNLLPTLGLVMHQVGHESKHMPLLDEGSPGHYGNAPLLFEEWWDRRQVIVLPHLNRHWTRKQLVLALAHKEGGAHVDAELDEAYEELVTNNGAGIMLGIGESEAVPFPGNLVAVSVRQIAFELTKTLEIAQDVLVDSTE